MTGQVMDVRRSPRVGMSPWVGCTIAALGVLACGVGLRAAKLVAIGDSRELREQPEETGPRPPSGMPLLILALDGVGRRPLYELLREGRLPGLERLLGGRTGRRFEHAYFDPGVLAPFPAVTLVGWSTIFTGERPAATGIPGNEFFIREERRFVAPIPGSFEAREPVIATYTDDYANELLRVPTIYERLRRSDPDVSIWVSVSQFYRGADRLLIARRSGFIDMFTATTKDILNGESYAVFQKRDEEVIDSLIDELEDRDQMVPDVLTLYVSGIDGYEHAAPKDPDASLREFMTGNLDRMFGELAAALERRGALAERYVLLVADHGHSEVPHDGSTLLSTDAADGPPAVLTGAGFRLRPFALDTATRDFQAVLAYQGPVAYVYLADRSTCAKEGTECDWQRPPRFRQDVLAAAEAYYRANRSGHYAPHLANTLDLILARRPRPYPEDDLPFEVYAGGGRLVPVKEYLRRHPRPRWVAFESRLRDLAVGRYGERAGDVVLLARDGAGDGPAGRYYFGAARQESVHGGPSRRDAEVPLILAHRGRTTRALRSLVRGAFGQRHASRHFADLVSKLREADASRLRSVDGSNGAGP